MEERLQKLLREKYMLLKLECPVIERKYWECIEDMQAEVFRKKLSLMEKEEPDRDFSAQYEALRKMQENRRQIEERYLKASEILSLSEEEIDSFLASFYKEDTAEGEDTEFKVKRLEEEIKNIKISFPYNKRFTVGSEKTVKRHRDRLQKLLDEYNEKLGEQNV